MKQIAAGDNHTVCLSQKGQVYSWGCGSQGQTGLGLYEDISTPQNIIIGITASDTEIKIKKIDSKRNLTILLGINEKQIYYFGNGKNRSTPTNHPFPGKSNIITSLSCGSYFLSYCTSTGKSFYACWKDEKLKSIDHHEVLFSYLSPFIEIDLHGSSAVFVSSSKENLFIYDKEQQIWVSHFPFENNLFKKTILKDNVCNLICSNYHSACIVSRTKNNQKIQINESIHSIQFENLLKSNEFYDIILESSDKIKFYVHKCILLSNGSYFKQLLHQNNHDNLIELSLPICSISLRCLLEILYSGRILSKNQFSMIDICSLLHDFDLDEFIPIDNNNFKYYVKDLFFIDAFHRFYNLFLNSNESCDIILKTNASEQIKCHRVILSTRSEFFNALLRSGFKECENNIIQIPNTSIEALKKVCIYFIYIFFTKLLFYIIIIINTFTYKNLCTFSKK